MRLSTIVFSFAVLALSVPLSRGADADDAIKKLQGVWKVVQAEKQGALLPDERIKALRVTIGNGKISIRDGLDEDVATIKIDSSATPATIDFTPAGEGKAAALGIYAFDNELLKICWAGVGRNRPAEFRSKAETDTRLFVLSREK